MDTRTLPKSTPRKTTSTGQTPRLLDQVRERPRVNHYSLRTEASYVGWIKRFILFHDKKHPKEMGGPQVEAFLTSLAVDRNVAAATQNQALSALLFWYKEVLGVFLASQSSVKTGARLLGKALPDGYQWRL